MRRGLLICAALLLAVGGACSAFPKKNQAERDREAIAAALQKHLSSKGGLNLTAMDIVVKDVKYRGSQVEAEVEFRARQGGGTMQKTYQLERQGNDWVVQSSSGHGTAPPQAEEGMPPGAGTLPPGHPPIRQPSNPAPSPQP